MIKLSAISETARIKNNYEISTANNISNGERQNFLPKIMNKARMSALTSSIEHYQVNNSQFNKARKRNGTQFEKEQ